MFWALSWLRIKDFPWIWRIFRRIWMNNKKFCHDLMRFASYLVDVWAIWGHVNVIPCFNHRKIHRIHNKLIICKFSLSHETFCITWIQLFTTPAKLRIIFNAQSEPFNNVHSLSCHLSPPIWSQFNIIDFPPFLFSTENFKILRWQVERVTWWTSCRLARSHCARLWMCACMNVDIELHGGKAPNLPAPHTNPLF